MDVAIQPRIEPLVSEWEQLADRTGASPFVRPGWISAWWRAFGRGSLAIVTARRGTKLVAVLPLYLRHRALHSPTNWHTPQFGLVAESGAGAEVLRTIFRWRPRQLSLAFLDADGTDVADLRSAGRERDYRLVARTLERSPYLDIDGDWATYEAELNHTLLQKIRRRRKRLEAQGTVHFEVDDGSTRLDELLAEAFAVEGSGWKSERRTAILSHPETLRFYTDVARWAAARGSLRLLFLRFDGRPIACQLALEEAGVSYLVKVGYDPDYRSSGPGVMLQRESLERAFRIGLRRYEFLGDEEPTKRRWTATIRERVLVQAFAPTITGRAEWAAFAYGRPAAKRALAPLRR